MKATIFSYTFPTLEAAVTAATPRPGSPQASALAIGLPAPMPCCCCLMRKHPCCRRCCTQSCVWSGYNAGFVQFRTAQQACSIGTHGKVLLKSAVVACEQHTFHCKLKPAQAAVKKAHLTHTRCKGCEATQQQPLVYLLFTCVCVCVTGTPPPIPEHIHKTHHPTGVDAFTAVPALRRRVDRHKMAPSPLQPHAPEGPSRSCFHRPSSH